MAIFGSTVGPFLAPRMRIEIGEIDEQNVLEELIDIYILRPGLKLQSDPRGIVDG